MNLVILAAGHGSRLSPTTDNIPKCLLPIDQSVTILDHQLGIAKQCGINKVMIVVGYRAEAIEEHISRYKDDFEELGTLYNPFYRTTNNLVSFWVALGFLGEDFVMMNGDTIPNKTILESILAADKEFVVPISKKSLYDSDDTKLILEGDSISQIGKTIDLEDVDAEWMGICAVRGDGCRKIREKINEVIRIPSLLVDYPHYLSVFQGLIDDGSTMDTITFESDFWAEIDYQVDLDFVRANIRRYRS